jgi:hypothetical protein
VSNTATVSDIDTLLSTVTSKNTDGKVLCYFGVVGTESIADGYLITENYSGVISNIIKLSGVTTFTVSDFASPTTLPSDVIQPS